MIARIWHGMTDASKADEYLRFVRQRAIPDYTAVPGNRGAYVLRRIDGDRAHFLTLSFWDSLEAIRGFAGEDIEKAVYYPEDQDFLLELEPEVVHYELYETAGYGYEGREERIKDQLSKERELRSKVASEAVKDEDIDQAINSGRE